MGKRSTTSTKSGRAMNPADQARKEARRRELKKNKKQRQVVREAVIKAKDPKKVLEELERLDQMEYNIQEAPPLPEHVLLERRKRLLGNFNRCLSLYDKEDKNMYGELKRMLAGYHRKHDELRKYYDSVKKAQSVSVDDIPLPAMPLDDDAAPPSDLPGSSLARTSLGPVIISAPKQPSWEMFSDDLSDTGGKRPPGPPCCPPPSLSDDSDDEFTPITKPDRDKNDEVESDDDEEEDEELEEQPAKPKVEQETKNTTLVPPHLESVRVDDSSKAEIQTAQRPDKPTNVPRTPFVPPSGPNFRTVPPPHLPGYRFPPPGRPGHPGMPRMGMMRPPQGFPQGLGPIGPMLRGPSVEMMGFRLPIVPATQAAEGKATIAAKPQLRNMMAEVTRLIPTAVKIRREEQPKPKPKSIAPLGPNMELIPHRPVSSIQQLPKKSADMAYDDFLKEMEGLL